MSAPDDRRDCATGKPAPGVIAVSLGDPAGIGPDIVIAAAASGLKLPAFAVYGDAGTLSERVAQLGVRLDVESIDRPGDAARLPAGCLGAIAVAPLGAPVVAGRADPANARAIIDAIERATAAVARGESSAIVTCPISKATLYAAGFRHPGHTEFLAELAQQHWPERPAVPVMMLACDELRVVPLTVHIPLAEVPRRLDGALIEATARIVASDLTRYFGMARPRLAVCGLNPHAGEGGTIGREEVETIAPALRQLREEGLDIAGPLSADTMFHAAARARYDVAIAMYHDQALIPIKTLAFDSGVNVTLGLPFVRTSPDHGTAFDIAGSGRAKPESFIAALRLAERMAAHAPASQTVS